MELTRRRLIAMGTAGLFMPFVRVPLIRAQDEPITVAFVYVGPTRDGGWTQAHDEGRRYLEGHIAGVQTIYQENTPENPADAERVIRDFANKGAKVIFPTSFGFMDPTINVAKDFPETTFVHISGYKTAENVGTLFGWQDEPRYVCGQVAGAMSEGGNIGMVAAFPIPEVIRAINAFTLGSRQTRSDATVRVVWTNTWFDPQKERAAAEALLDGGVDLMAQYQDTPAPAQAAEKRGLYAIGNDLDMSPVVGNQLTAPVWIWGPTYTDIVQRVLAGTYEPSNELGSWATGITGLAPLHDDVPEDVAALVASEEASFVNGEQSEFTIFTGPLVDQDGTERVPAGQAMTTEELLSMDWFVDGVEGELPDG